MTALPVPALATETAGWIKDLTIADPTYILPMIAAGTLSSLLSIVSVAVTVDHIKTKTYPQR
jgi:membrane protein insertase Oxa1/YidC/SpoIIIJ